MSRVEQPLLQALRLDARFVIRRVGILPGDARLLFPSVYGPVPLRLAFRRAALTHLTSSWCAHVVPLLRNPTVVTCHDLIELEDLESGARPFKPHRRFHVQASFRGMLHGRFIICVSGATARAVLARAPEVEQRVRIIHSGLSPTFTPRPVDTQTLKQFGIQQPYVLYVGSEQPRKNLARLVRAVGAARRNVPDLRLVKVGAHQTAQGREDFLQALKDNAMIECTSILENVSDEQLAVLYRGAAVTALVSLREGFGFPPLESMACGSPAIVSDRSSLPEITGGDALTVDPLDVRAIAQAIEAVVSNEELSRDLRSRGPLRAAAFSWDRAAKAYGDLYEEAIQGR